MYYVYLLLILGTLEVVSGIVSNDTKWGRVIAGLSLMVCVLYINDPIVFSFFIFISSIVNYGIGIIEKSLAIGLIDVMFALIGIYNLLSPHLIVVMGSRSGWTCRCGRFGRDKSYTFVYTAILSG